jgi:hypothetical protein
MIWGMGELHLEIIVDRMKREFNVEANTGRPQVAYKETISQSADVEHKYVKQSGGKGQYGHVKFRVSPLDYSVPVEDLPKNTKRVDGMEFINNIKGGVIPNEYIPAVEKGVREAMQRGVLAGYPMVDLQVDLYDGSYHDVDSSEIAFKLAAMYALKEAAEKARPVILEPMMRVEITVPEKFLGDITGNVSSKRGQIEGVDDREMVKTIRCIIPLSEMFGYMSSIQAGLVIEDLDVELSSSDGVSGSSNISLRYGDLSLGASNQLTIYPNVIQFSSFFSGRDDSGTSFPTNFLYTDGTGKLQSAPTSLLGGGGSSLSSQDEGTLLTSTTTGYNFIGAGVTATESGGLVTVNIPGGVGGANIYNTNGTLTNNRTLNGNGRSLSFTNLSQFLSVTQNGNTYSGLIDNVTGVGYGRYVLSTKQLISGVEHTTSISSDISGFGGDWDSLNAGIIDVNLTTDNGAAFEVQGDSGISFIFRNSGIMDGYVFPRTDGTANQILTTDGLGQLSWQNAGGGSALQLYSENPSLPYTSPVASGLNSVAIGNGARASADDMIVWGKMQVLVHFPQHNQRF